MKKRFFSILMVFVLFVGIGFQGVSAEWRQGDNGWNYYENSSLKIGWLQQDGKWYYLNNLGNMLTGWITDKGTWYYLLENGSLDNSKTTTIMPTEIQETYNIVKSFTPDLNISYAGKSLIKKGTTFDAYGLQDGIMIGFSSKDDQGNNCNYYFYDPVNCGVYVLYSDFTSKYLGQGNMSNSITKDKAIENVKKYIAENNINVSGMELWVTEKNNIYTVNYSALGTNDQMSIANKFIVDKSTGNVINIY